MPTVDRKYSTDISLQTVTEKNVFDFEIQKLTAECECMITYEISHC